MDWSKEISPDDVQDMEDFAAAVQKKLCLKDVNSINSTMLELSEDLTNIISIIPDLENRLDEKSIRISINWAILIRIYNKVSKIKTELKKLTSIKLMSEPCD